MRTTKYVIALDIGGATRNAFCAMSSNMKVERYSSISYADSKTKLEHRQKIILELADYLREFNNEASIVFERINLYRGGAVSHLYNIISLCRVQTTIINEFSEIVPIYDIAVKSWKARSLKSGNATKEDSINMVNKLYPDINLETVIRHKRKSDEVAMNHDLADAILIARACFIDPLLLDDKNKLNYK